MAAVGRNRLTCFDKAVDLLGRRPHFAAELAAKLRRSGYADEEVDETVARLTERGWLDDVTLARERAAALGERKALGRARIGRDLARRGAPAAAVAAALAGVGWEKELARAREAARRWSRQRRERRDGAALARHLDRKGYSRRAIFSVLAEIGLPASGIDSAEE